MADLTVKQKQIFDNYKKTHPKMSDVEILSALVNLGQIQLSKEQKLSLFNNSTNNDSGMGLKLERTQKSANPTNQPQETVFLQSGRKIVITKSQDEKDLYKYYAADGTQLNPDYFKQQEGVVRVSANRKTYTVTKNGKTVEKQAKNPLMAKIDQQQAELNKTKKQQGFLGKSWDWFKNTTGIGDGSNKAQKQLDAERKLVQQIQNGKISKKDFKDVTGLDYSQENLQKFKNGEIELKSTEKIKGYQEGQEMACDVAGDLVSGIAAVGIYSLAVAAAPFTGGASIAVGIGAAALSGAAIKAGIKALDATTGGRKYFWKDLGHDSATGAFSGLLAPITGGMGGAVGKTVATKLGVQAVKSVGKEVAETVVETGVKQGVKEGIKTALVNPTGYEYIGGTLVKRAAAMSAEMATDGALGGAIDGGFRAGLDNDWDSSAILSGTVEGGIGGALMAPIIGGGFKAVGKGGHKLGEKINGGKKASDAVEDIVGKEIVESAEEVPPKTKVGETTQTNESEKPGKILEGGVKDTDLEEVAPFAQHLTEEKHIGDIAIPNKDRLEIENGDFVNSEFVPDGSVTVYANANNPLNKKSFTWKGGSYRSHYPSFLVAQNKKELSKQIADIWGEKKISQFLSKQIDEILEKNSDIKISDLSEIIGCLNNINLAKKFIGNEQLKKITNIKRFKENVENYAEFLYKLEHAELGYQGTQNVIAQASRFNIFDGDFVKFLEKVDSKDFEANCAAYIEMRSFFKSDINPRKFLSTYHEQKCFDRLKVIEDFNYEHTDYNCHYDGNVSSLSVNIDEINDDKMFSELLERMEYCKKAKKYSKVDAEQILHYGKGLEWFKTFDSTIPDGVKFNVFRYYREITLNAPDNVEKFTEFCNSCPKEWFDKLFKTNWYKNRETFENDREIRNLMGSFGAKCYDDRHNHYNYDYKPITSTPDEILKRLNLLKKVEHLAKYEYGNQKGVDVYNIDRILCSWDIKDLDKGLKFLDIADEGYLKRICIDGAYDRDSYDLFRIMNEHNLDNMIENAKLYNSLPESFKKYQTDKGYSYNVKLDVEPNEFKARIEIIQKYADKLDNDTLDRILHGNYTSEIKNYERLFELPEKVRNIVLDKNYGADSYIRALGTLSDDGYKKFVKLINETKFNDNEIRNFVSHIDYRISLWEELSFDELNAINPRVFAGDWSYPNIDIIKKRISKIPDRMRSYIKYADESCELMQWASSWFDTEYETAQRVIAAIQRLNKLSDRDLNNIGANGLNRFLDENKYHLANSAMFPKEKLEQLNKLPKGILERLQEHNSAIYNLLMDEGDIDVKTMISRYNLLESNGLLESGKINKDNFYALMVAGEDKFSVISEILASSTRKIDNIDWLIGALPSSEIVRKHHDFIFETLINNQNNDVNNISSQLNYVFRNRDGWGKSDADIEVSIEFAKKVVKDLIKRGDINEGEAGNKYLLSNFFSAIKSHRNDGLEYEQAKYASLIKNIDNKGAQKSDIISLYGNIEGHEHLNVIDDLLNKSKFNFETIVKLNKTIYNRNYSKTKIKFLDKMLKEGKVKEEHIVDILDAITDENVKFADKIIHKNPLKISHENLMAIIREVREANADLTEKLLYDKKHNFPPEQIPKIINKVNINNGEFAEKLCYNKEFPKELIPQVLNVTYHKEMVDFADNLINNIKELKYSPEFATEIIQKTYSHNNIELAEFIIYKKELDFPKDKILSLLNCRISSDITIENIAEKAKKFYELIPDDDEFIKDILENSSTLTFYSDEVLKILKKRKTDDPDTPLKDIIKALVGINPQKLQERIDTLILLAKFSNEEVSIFKKQGVDVNNKIEQLEKLINSKHHLISTTQTDVVTFLKAFANNKNAEDVIRNADFAQFGKDGIRLQYSREEFIRRMNQLSGGDFSEIARRSKNIQIPELKLSDADINATQERIKELKLHNKSEKTEFVMDGEAKEGTRFLNTQGGSNKAYMTEVDGKLYYIKYPESSKLEQSVQEVMASELYRAAGIDAPNMKIIYDKDGNILGMASEYVPKIEGAADGKQLWDSFGADAWLADWDAPKHGNSAMKNGSCLKMDVGGSMDFRAQGERKLDFGNKVEELTSLIEQNSAYSNMTKTDVLTSLKHITSVTDEQIWKIVENVPAEFRNYSLGQKMITRRNYIKQFIANLENVDETKFKSILDLMNETKIKTSTEFEEGINIASLLGYEQTPLGFEGLLNTRDLSNFSLKPYELSAAQKMIKEIEDFTKYNRVADDLPLPNSVKDFLNSILKGIPEFAAYFSKPQHSVQNYSLDIHILKVLQDSLKDPDYSKLSDEDKIVLKFSTLLHDIGKKWLGGKDTGHAELSADYVLSILDRFKLSEETKDRVVSIVYNHHWFKDFCLGNMNESTMATLARRPQDWLIYKIMAKADLINVSESHALRCVKGATSMDDIWQVFDKNVTEIEANVQKLREKQVVVTTSKWTEVPERVKSNGNIVPARGFNRKTATIDGVETEIKYLNLEEIGEEEDMFKYGFNHIMKKALRFIVHMPDGDIKYFNIFKTLAGNPLNNSAQSMSLITPFDTSTYCGRQFGFILDIENANISHAYFSNTGSGTRKGLKDFVHEMFEEGHHRSYVKDKFKEFLRIERGINIDDTAYANITEYIMNKKYPETQLLKMKNLTIEGTTYKMQDILDAFTFSRDQLSMEKRQKAHGSHSELVGLNAKVKGLVAKVKSFEELPEYFLRFAKENDLPIILIGNH